MSTLVSLRVGFDRVVSRMTTGNRALVLLASLITLSLLVALGVYVAISRPVARDLAIRGPASLAENPELMVAQRYVSPATGRGEEASLDANPELSAARNYDAPTVSGDDAASVAANPELGLARRYDSPALATRGAASVAVNPEHNIYSGLLERYRTGELIYHAPGR